MPLTLTSLLPLQYRHVPDILHITTIFQFIGHLLASLKEYEKEEGPYQASPDRPKDRHRDSRQ